MEIIIIIPGEKRQIYRDKLTLRKFHKITMDTIFR